MIGRGGQPPARLRGKDPLEAHSLHTPASLRARGSRGTGALCPRWEPRDLGGFVPPAPPSRRGSQLRSGASSRLSRLLRFSTGGLVCGRGHVGFCFLSFSCSAGRFFRRREEGTHPHSSPPLKSPPTRVLKDPALCLPFLLVASSEVTFLGAKFTFSEGFILRN